MQDKFGQEISANSFVVAPRGLRDLALCRVVKVNDKTLTLDRIDKISNQFYGRPGDVILVNSQDVLSYKLKSGIVISN